MFGFHSRSRSLIPVKDLEKYEASEKATTVEEVEVWQPEEPIPQTKRERRNLILIYLLFLVEAIMAASLTSQIEIILPADTSCVGMDISFLRSILQCAYYSGNATGLLWGMALDKIGRRPIALIGLMGMTLCCIFMMFANAFISFAVLRYCAGVASSAVTIAGLTMLADATHGNRIRAVSRLPMVAVCGQLGPFLANSIVHLARGRLNGAWAIYEGLAGQMACAVLVFAITTCEALMLDETYSRTARIVQPLVMVHDEDSEKAAFLDRDFSDGESEAGSSKSSQAPREGYMMTSAVRPSSISLTQMLTAPSVLLLLSSFSLLSLHSTIFDIFLPHLSHTPTHAAGMGIPCTWLSTITFLISVIAALRILHFLPPAIARFGGALACYRRISVIFPIIYLIIPAAGLAISIYIPSSHGHDTSADDSLAAWLPSAIIAVIAMLLKTTLAQAARVLVLLLALAAAPDAGATGTLIGVVSVSDLCKALALGAAGIAYYLSDDYGTLVVNGCVWAVLFGVAGTGAGLAWWLRGTPRVGTDLPEECFAWQGVFDVESGDEYEVKEAEEEY